MNSFLYFSGLLYHDVSEVNDIISRLTLIKNEEPHPALRAPLSLVRRGDGGEVA
jgi:hypothetical protein